jgi:TonB family protein
MELLFRNLVAHALQAALLAAGATLLARALARLHPQLTVNLWQGVLLATAILPFAQPRAPVSYHLVLSEHVSGPATTLTGLSAGLTFSGVLLPALAIVLVSGAILRLAWILYGMRQLRAFAAAAIPFHDLPPSIRAAMKDAGTIAEFRQSDVAGPVSFGLWRGIVVLPRDFLVLDAEGQYLVAFHELIHVRRRDAVQSLAEECLTAVLWFYPWVWWIRRRIHLAREQAVDRVTAPTRSLRPVYIRTLLSFAGHQSRALPTSAMWRAHELRTRIDALYEEVVMSRSRLTLAAIATLMALGAVAALGAAVFPLYSPSVPESPGMGPTTINAQSAYGVGVQQSSPDDEVVKVGGDVRPPRKIKDVKPVYPEDAREARIEGVVIVEAVIDKEGKVARADVIKSIPELDQAAVDAVLQWEFEPTYIKGKAVSVRMTVTINFTLA